MKPRTLIEACFRDIPDVYDGFNLARDNVYRLALEGERKHRSGRSTTTPQDFTASLAAKYFTVKWLAEYASNRSNLPTIADVHRLRPDVVLAASYAAYYPETLGPWARAIPAEFWSLDYAVLMS